MDWKIINITLKNTLPEVSKDCCNLIFYVKKTNMLYLGFYDGTSFYAYRGKTSDFAWTMKLVGVFDPGDVTAFIVVNEINQKDFKDIGYGIVDDATYLVKIKTGNTFFLTLVNKKTIEDEEFTMDAATFFRLPVLPDFVNTNEAVDGKYKWMLVDYHGGFYTYNFFKKHWLFGWRHYGRQIVETTSMKEGYDIANRILKTYATEEK